MKPRATWWKLILFSFARISLEISSLEIVTRTVRKCFKLLLLLSRPSYSNQNVVTLFEVSNDNWRYERNWTNEIRAEITESRPPSKLSQLLSPPPLLLPAIRDNVA